MEEDGVMEWWGDGVLGRKWGDASFYPILQYSSTPALQQYSITPALQFSCIPALHHSITPLLLS